MDISGLLEEHSDELVDLIKNQLNLNSDEVDRTLKSTPEAVGETEKILSKINKPRNRYINDAIKYYNRIQNRALLEKKLNRESTLVKADSMDVLKDFEEIDYV